MEKTNTLWEKYNIFKHWPPLVRAYRQNASGMEVSPSQKRYLKWGSLIPVILFSIGWFIYYLPYFKHQADIGFFAYTGNFVSPFFDGTSAPQLSEFLWRFVSQFYFNTPLIIAVVAFLVIGFCITSWKTAGPYTPFLLLLFFLLRPAPPGLDTLGLPASLYGLGDGLALLRHRTLGLAVLHRGGFFPFGGDTHGPG